MAPQAGEADIRDWCVRYLAGALEVPSARIGIEVRFTRMGLDSAAAVNFLVELETWLGREIDPEAVFEYPTINALARHLAQADGGRN